MRYAVAAVIAGFFAILQVSMVPYVEILGVTPDFVLIFVASWSVIRGQDEATVVLPLAGLLKDLASSDPLGTSVVALAPIAFLAAATRLRVLDTQFLPTVLVVASGTLAYGMISMTVLAISGQTVVLQDAALRVLLPACLVNALFTPLVYLPLHTFSPQQQSGPIGTRRLTSPL